MSKRSPGRWGATLLLLFIVGPWPLCQAESIEEIYRATLTSFATPLRDLMKKEHSNEWHNLFSGLSGSLALNYPLQETMRETRGLDGSQIQEGFHKSTLSASFKYNPISYWFAAVTFNRYLDLARGDLGCMECRSPWDPDFSYSFGYDDWHPYTVSLTYANFGGNRLNPDKKKGETVTDFQGGTYSLGWKFPVPRAIEELVIIHPTGGLAGGINVNLTPKFSDLATLSEKSWKQTLSLSLKYTIHTWWYANATVTYYPHPEQQQPWDPDYTYGFGYFDWHPGTLSLQYNNYSGNRYPWKTPSPDTGAFKNGSLSLIWSWIW